MHFKTLAEVWSHYDVKDLKGFDALDILTAISSVPQEQDVESQDSRRFELLAFSFAPRWETKNSHYYYYPGASITPEMISYWENRAFTVINPLLKMRYTGLVLDYKKQITGINPDFKTIKLANVEAIIDVVAGDYCKRHLTTLDYAARAMKLSKGFRNKDLEQQSAKAFYDAHKRIAANDSSSGLWGGNSKSSYSLPRSFYIL